MCIRDSRKPATVLLHEIRVFQFSQTLYSQYQLFTERLDIFVFSSLAPVSYTHLGVGCCTDAGQRWLRFFRNRKYLPNTSAISPLGVINLSLIHISSRPWATVMWSSRRPTRHSRPTSWTTRSTFPTSAHRIHATRCV